jgi:hypothetical protein
MNTTINPEPRRPLRTSDLASAGTPPSARDEVDEIREEAGSKRRQSPEAGQTASESAQGQRPSGSEQLEPLFPPDASARFRGRWAEVQSSFVDDPRRAVASGDELVAEVMKSLAESFAHERERLENELSQTGEASTETLRVGLRRYRSFFERLLSL